MNTLERLCKSLRHNRRIESAGWLWNSLRAPYQALLRTSSRNGLERVMNGSDVVRVMPEYRSIPEDYERDVWRCVMEEARPGNVVVDVGANVGIYTVALANRVGTGGRVHAFEPDPANYRALERHCRLNGILDRVSLYQAAVADRDCRIVFDAGRGVDSHISSAGDGSAGDGLKVDCFRLDSVFDGVRIEMMKIDVEGFEEAVLKGGSGLLNDSGRAPRVIYIEVHPFAWKATGTTSSSLLALLTESGYSVQDLSGRSVTHIDTYGEVVARRHRG